MAKFEYAPAPESRAVVTIAPSYGLFIGGQFVDSLDGSMFKTISPSSEEVLAEVTEAGQGDVDAAVRAARKAFEGPWGALSGAERGKYLFRIARILQERAREFAVLETLDNGKPIKESRDVDIPLAAAHFFYHGGWADKLEHAGLCGGGGQLPKPIGVVGQVIPWNFPMLMLSWKIAPALAAGNTVVLKSAETTPVTPLMLAELAAELLPPGVLNVVCGGRDTGAAMVAHPVPAMVALTGSVEAGRSVAARAGHNLKKSTMELGGSDAFIVLADADLDQAVRWALWGRMNNTGQCCVAAKRFIVVEAVADRFLAGFQAALAALKPGDPMNPATTLGPLSTEAALLTLLDQVDRAVAAGATAVIGGHRIDRPGSFMQPTILAGIMRDNPAFNEEFFGPVALFFRVADEDAAVALANDSPFGLGGSVFTADVARGKRVAARIETGMVFINHPTWTAPDLPFGGVKDSGYGRELSGMGIQEFVNKKLVRVAATSDAA